MMDTSVASVNSALQRARRIVDERIGPQTQQQELRGQPAGRARELVDAFAAALEDGDPDALVALLTEDVTWSMPPQPQWYRGLAAVRDFAVAVPLACGTWRHRATSANGQPAVACYLWDDGAGSHLPWAVNVLAVRDGRIAEITSFIGPEYFALLGLPAELA
jgi:RNA polymerase sigma-70 factor (ECF subfamily)